jgi:hypothetical protein
MQGTETIKVDEEFKVREYIIKCKETVRDYGNRSAL